MKTITPTGITMIGICEVQTTRCVARELAPITAVFEEPRRIQINACRPCLEEQIRAGNWRIQGARIRMRADVAVYDRDGALGMVVEVKKSPSLDRMAFLAWGRQIRQQLLSYGALPAAPILIIVAFPRFLFLWRTHMTEENVHDPQYCVDLKNTLDQFVDGREQYDHFAMEQAVAAWLTAIKQDPSVAGDFLPVLQQEGLLALLQRGSIVMEASHPKLPASSR